jgi:penicillin-binding protein A
MFSLRFCGRQKMGHVCPELGFKGVRLPDLSLAVAAILSFLAAGSVPQVLAQGPQGDPYYVPDYHYEPDYYYEPERRPIYQPERDTSSWSTLDPALQATAYAALGGQEGAIVAMDPITGEVRALASEPKNLATEQTFPPGSTFKLVVAAAALESGRYTAESEFKDPVALTIPQTPRPIMNITKEACTGTGRIDLFAALKLSCDTTFATMGLRIHKEIREMAGHLGFNKRIPFDQPVVASRFPAVTERNQPFRAYQALGQGNVSATPLQMTLVAAAIANDGILPRPKLEREPYGLARGAPAAGAGAGAAMSPATAEMLTRMMVASVNGGTGTSARIPGLSVAGKTGTAQHVAGAPPHLWFVGFAPAEEPRIAVTVFLKSSNLYGDEATGGIVAAPLARQIIEADRSLQGW